jgi:hypothetical protein
VNLVQHDYTSVRLLIMDELNAKKIKIMSSGHSSARGSAG